MKQIANFKSEGHANLLVPKGDKSSSIRVLALFGNNELPLKPKIDPTGKIEMKRNEKL